MAANAVWDATAPLQHRGRRRPDEWNCTLLAGLWTVARRRRPALHEMNLQLDAVSGRFVATSLPSQRECASGSLEADLDLKAA